MEPMAQTAADRYRTPQPIIEELTLENESINRYVWYAGEDLPWPEIKGGFIRRCRVTPIVPFLTWERISDVPEDMRKRLRRDWTDPKHAEAQYEIKPQGIFDSVMETYGVLGLRELEFLRGKSEQEVAALNLDLLFCPWQSEDVPKPYRMIEEHIRQAIQTVNGNSLLRKIGEEMLRSIAVSRAYDEQLVDIVESQKELKYSNPAFRALSRLERSRRDKALNAMAEADLAAKNAKAEQSSDNSELIAEMREQNRLKREELELRREELELNRQIAAKGKPGRKPVEANA